MEVLLWENVDGRIVELARIRGLEDFNLDDVQKKNVCFCSAA